MNNTDSASSVAKLLSPKSIAIVGASARAGSLGMSVLDNLDRFGFPGAVYLVNPQYDEIGGRRCYSSVSALPAVPDCVVVVVPRGFAPSVLREAAEMGVGAAVIIAGGFAEQDDEGAALQAELVSIATRHDMAVLGPNCLGLVNYTARTPMLFGAAAPSPKPVETGIAVISQSGAMAAVIRVALQARGLDITYGVSTGNEAVMGTEDVLDHMAGDEATRVIAVLAEQIRRPGRFLKLVHKARSNGKQVVLLHLGRSSAGKEAAQSHTGALSGDFQVMEAAVTAAGVTLVDSLEALIDVSELQFRYPETPLGRAAIITESGAFRGLTLDYCEAYGVPVPEFSEQTLAELRAVLPAIAQAENPLDLTAAALVDPDLYGKVLRAVSQDEGVDCSILVVTLPSLESASRKLPPIINSLKQSPGTKPVLFAMLGEDSPVQEDFIEEMRGLNTAFFRSPERVFRALAPIRRTEQAPKLALSEPLLASGAAPLPAGIIPEYQAKSILRDFGVAFAEGALARTPDEAVQIARSLNGPVALKIQSPEIPHKSDIGGVALGLEGDSAVDEAFRTMTASIRAAAPQADIHGVLVEAMSSGRGVEMILGIKKDPDWGTSLLIGFGGVTAELLKDVAILPAHADEAAIRHAIESLRGAPLLNGYRGALACNVDALVSLTMKLGKVAAEYPGISELDLNPVVVSAEGALALDALLVVEQA